MARQSSSAGRRSTVPALVLVGLGTFLITIALALVFFVVPGQKKTPLDINSTTVTEVSQGAVLVAGALATNTPTDLNADRAECRAEETEAAEGDDEDGADPANGEAAETVEGDEADDSEVQFPVSCFIDNEVPLYSQRRVQAVEPSDGDIVTLQAAQSLLRDDLTGGDDVDALVNATVDRVTVDRVSSEPIDEPVSTLQVVAGGEDGEETAPVGFVREGLQYKFPFDTEQRTYQYFDASTFTTNPIEFIGETTVGGIEAYEFEQEIGPIDMWTSIRDHFAAISDGYDPAVESVLASYRREGMTADQWGMEGDPEREVDMRRFYSNTRTVWVNPDTGQVVDGKENIFQFFAEDQDAAEALVGDPEAMEAERIEPTQTAVRFESGWNEQTTEETLAGAQDSADSLNTFGTVLPAVLGVLGVLALIGGAVLGVRAGGAGAAAGGRGAGRGARADERGAGPGTPGDGPGAGPGAGPGEPGPRA